MDVSRTVKNAVYTFLAALFLTGCVQVEVHAYEGGILKNHNHTSVSGDGGTLSNLTVSGFVKISTTNPTGFIFQDGSTMTSAGITAPSSPTVTGAWNFNASTPPIVSTGITLGSMADPASPSVGQLWYNSTVNRLKYNANGTTVEIDPSFYVVHFTSGPASNTGFLRINGNCQGVIEANSSLCSSPTEPFVSGPVGIATLQRFSCSYMSSTGNGSTLTFTVDKNEAATTMTCNFSAPAANSIASCATNTNPVTLASNDRISMKLVSSPGNVSAPDIVDCVMVYSMGTQ